MAAAESLGEGESPQQVVGEPAEESWRDASLSCCFGEQRGGEGDEDCLAGRPDSTASGRTCGSGEGVLMPRTSWSHQRSFVSGAFQSN